MKTFNLDQAVTITATGQKGTIVGVCTYSKDTFPDSYWVTFVNGNGNLEKTWFDQSDLT